MRGRGREIERERDVLGSNVVVVAIGGLSNVVTTGILLTTIMKIIHMHNMCYLHGYCTVYHVLQVCAHAQLNE